MDATAPSARPAPGARPVLKPALRRLWRDRVTLQLGVDAGRALVLADVDERDAALLALLDGVHEPAAAAAAAGVPAERAAVLVELLDRGGALDRSPGAVRGALLDHDRLAPDLASLSLLHRTPGAAEAVLDRRHRTAVRVVGAGRLGAPLAALLTAAGVGTVRVEDAAPVAATDVAPGGHTVADIGLPRQEAVAAAARRVAAATATTTPTAVDLVVLAAAGTDTVATLQRAGQPHLAVSVREITGVVGPLVVPGASACLRCLDLTRADRDPSWPLVAAQLDVTRPVSVEPCDVALAALTTAVAALQSLTFLDGLAVPATVGGTLELTLPDWRLRRRSWTRHPDCGCG